MKRTVQINVKMTEDDYAQLQEAAKRRWPDAVMTNSGILLSLARMAAKTILSEKKGR